MLRVHGGQNYLTKKFGWDLPMSRIIKKWAKMIVYVSSPAKRMYDYGRSLCLPQIDGARHSRHEERRAAHTHAGGRSVRRHSAVCECIAPSRWWQATTSEVLFRWMGMRRRVGDSCSYREVTALLLMRKKNVEDRIYATSTWRSEYLTKKFGCLE